MWDSFLAHAAGNSSNGHKTKPRAGANCIIYVINTNQFEFFWIGDEFEKQYPERAGLSGRGEGARWAAGRGAVGCNNSFEWTRGDAAVYAACDFQSGKRVLKAARPAVNRMECG